MKHSIKIIAFFMMTTSAWTQDICNVSDQSCVVQTLLKQADGIDNKNWQSQIYREAAKTLAASNKIDQAIALLPKIVNPDTKALTIRGIGMEAAKLNLAQDTYNKLFETLNGEALKITHLPSKAIAFTYIAMAQAFAGDDNGAWKTAAAMDNEALRNKAYGETAEIQAEKGKYEEAMKSIARISTSSFKDKAYSTVSNILVDKTMNQNAFGAATKITNPYKQAKALQYILNKQNEQRHSVKDDAQ